MHLVVMGVPIISHKNPPPVGVTCSCICDGYNLDTLERRKPRFWSHRGAREHRLHRYCLFFFLNSRAALHSSFMALESLPAFFISLHFAESLSMGDQ